MRRKSFESATCPVARSLDVVGDWWSLLIVRDALYGTRRFSEFRRSLGLASNVLSARLKALVEQGILANGPAAEGSSYREYRLTEKGEALLPVIVALGQWGSEFLFEPGETQAPPLDAATGGELRRIVVKASDGRVLKSKDLVVGSFLTPSCG